MAPRAASTNADLRDRSRGALVEAAGRLFAERGYETTSLSAITAAAGVSHGLANYYFGSKRALLAAVIRPRLDQMLALVDLLPDDPDRALATMIDVHLAAVAEDPDGQALLLSLMIQPGVREVFAEVERDADAAMRAAEDRLAEVFARRGAEDPALEVVLLRSVVEGAILKAAIYGRTYPLEDVRRRLHALYGLPEPATALAGGRRTRSRGAIRMRADAGR
ncbi:hypothetical protein GCM10009788_35660 [Nocardioides humi]|uniref:HTH tetR-type domain-containing protein n=1 Tax=Nocardioides humi TaxID=449461 RepID=A0ABN2AYM3_9ACTN